MGDVANTRLLVAAGLAGLLAAGLYLGFKDSPGHGTIPGTVFRDCPDCPEMVVLAGGRFQMGSKPDPDSTFQPKVDETPAFVVLVGSFAIGRYEVTQAEWRAVMGDNPSAVKDPARPVEMVSWNDVQVFIQKLNERTGKKYRLPSQAEWEYSARAGSLTRYVHGDEPDGLADHAWFAENAAGSPHPVGGKQPNAFGLHDMHGNVWEWVQDCYADNYLGAPTDGSAVRPPGGATCNRVIRGGSWFNNARSLRSASRDRYNQNVRYNDLGFRLVQALP